MNRGVRIAPSLRSADFARLGEEVRTVIEADADLIHRSLPWAGQRVDAASEALAGQLSPAEELAA